MPLGKLTEQPTTGLVPAFHLLLCLLETGTCNSPARGLRETAQQLRALIACVENMGLIPSTTMAARNYSKPQFQGIWVSDILFCLPCMWCTNSHAAKNLIKQTNKHPQTNLGAKESVGRLKVWAETFFKKAAFLCCLEHDQEPAYNRRLKRVEGEVSTPLFSMGLQPFYITAPFKQTMKVIVTRD